MDPFFLLAVVFSTELQGILAFAAALLRRPIGDPDVEDAVQQTFVRLRLAYRGRFPPHFESVGRCRGFILRALKNVIIDTHGRVPAHRKVEFLGDRDVQADSGEAVSEATALKAAGYFRDIVCETLRSFSKRQYAAFSCWVRSLGDRKLGTGAVSHYDNHLHQAMLKWREALLEFRGEIACVPRREQNRILREVIDCLDKEADREVDNA